MRDQGGIVSDGGGGASVARPREERRRIGAFYTPAPLSAMLARWAIRSGDDTVLEPSFGGCGFLAAARDALNAHGAERPEDRVYGCDVDPVAFDHLAGDLPGWSPGHRLVLRDFLEAGEPEGWPRRFTTVLANPPYIRHQQLEADTRARLAAFEGAIDGVGGRAGLWAYFVSRAASLLALGGRMAWVLPGALMQADYARPVRDFLANRFDRCAAFLVHERLFLDEGTDEETVIVLADGFRAEGRSDGRLDVDEATTLDELQRLIDGWDAGDWIGGAGHMVPALIGWTDEARGLYARLEGVAVPLGDLAAVSIGLVTGANDFFVLSRAAAAAAGLREGDLLPVLPKFRAAPGVRFTADDHADYAGGGARALLVTSRGREANPRVSAYLETFDAARKASISTFRKRSSWSETCDTKLASAFMPVMHHEGPRLVLNEFGCANTNTVHRVVFNDDVGRIRRMLACISMLTTFSQLSGEIVGRRYGSGVLKHEPRDAERILLLIPELAEGDVVAAFDAIDAALRTGDAALATRLADEAVVGSADAGALDGIDLLRDALAAVRRRRRPDRRRNR